MPDSTITTQNNALQAPAMGPGSIVAGSNTIASPVAPIPTPDNGQIPFADAANTNVPTTLNAPDISSASGPMQNPTVPATKPVDELGGLLTSLKSQHDADQAARDKAASAVTGTQNDIQNLSAQLGGQTAFNQDQANAAGLPQMNEDLGKLHSTQSFQTAAYLNAVNNASTGPGGTKGYMNNELSNISRQHGLDALTTSALIDAKNNDITTAQAKVDKAVGLQFDPIKTALQAKLQVLQTNYNMLSSADKTLADSKAAELQGQLKQIDIHQTNVKDAISTAMTQVTNGALDGSTVSKAASDLMSGKSDLAGFYSAIGITPTSGTGSSGNGSAIIKNTMNMMGATSDMAVKDAIDTLGIDKVVAGLIGQEGGSPNGVVNNPGNIKFVGQAGATNSGVQATDGGTFASFATADAGQKAVAALVQNAANNGKNLSDFIASYKGVTNTTSPTYAQYGLLANTDFNPNDKADQNAKTYLDSYLRNASSPTASSIGISVKGNAGQAKLSAAKTRAENLYYAATGQNLPDPQILKATKALITQNNKVLNNNQIASETVAKNFDLAIKGEITNDVNKNATIVNRILNPVYLALGDPAVNQALVSNGTISQEFANLIAIRNAQGTTVADKEMGSELIRFGTSVEAQKAVVERLKQEATNIHTALKDQNSELYKQIDPLQVDPNNPNRSGSTPSGKTMKINGTDVVVGQIYTNAQGKQGRMNANGTISPI